MSINIKEATKKFWHFLWKEDSIWSWIASIIFAFVIVKFIFFPVLSLILGAQMPLVIVESESMTHNTGFFGDTLSLTSNFNEFWKESGRWYEANNITQEQASSWNFRTGIDMGDIVVVSRAKNLKVGEVIIFNANQKHPIIHRIVSIEEKNNEKIYSTKGDNNPAQLIIEKEIKESQIIGKALARIPKVGWVKLGIVKIFQKI